jgi:hypothetical protein
VALFQHFTYQDALLDTIYRTGGLIYRAQLDQDVPAGEHPAIIPELREDNPLVELAREFGQATSGRGALRSAIGSPPDPKAIQAVTEAHDRGAILVSAVFDAFFTVYVKRTRDLMRIARAGGALNLAGDLHPDLAQRLAREAASTASTVLNICIRALDYLPPVDVTFGEFLRAMITADSDFVPDDPLDYRGELIKAFRLRGITPRGVTSYSEEALRWQGPDRRGRPVEACAGLDYDMPRSDDPAEEDAHDRRQAANAVCLNAYASNEKNAEALGLNPALKVRAATYHPIHRISPKGKLVTEFVAELVQQRAEPLDPDLPGSETFTYTGGSTVIFDDIGVVRYVIEKSIDNQERLRRQRSFRVQQVTQSPRAPYRGAQVEQKLSFQLIHSGAR